MAETPKLSAQYVHLHNHTHYSLLGAVPTPKELAAAAKADGQDALAITDNGALYGAIDHYQACRKEEIKPIIGIDAYLAPRTRFDKEPIDKPRARLVLLAENETGYKNLIKLVTLGNTEGFYYRPRFDHELLAQYSEGLFCLLPSFAGETTHHLKNDDLEKAQAELDWYRGVYGEKLYLELTHHPEILDHQELQQKIIDLGAKTSTPLVAAQDIYYMTQDDAVAREAMLRIQSGGVVDAAEERPEDFSFKTQAEMLEKFTDQPEAIANTVQIAEACNIEITLGADAWMFPDYQIESGKTPRRRTQGHRICGRGVAWARYQRPSN